MNRATSLTLTAIAAIALALPATAAAQGSFTVDRNLAQRGKTLWITRGCGGCHAIGRKMAGPDLQGVLQRRDNDWLRRWLLETDQMIASGDPQVEMMLEEWNYIKMPEVPLSEAEVDALFHYIQMKTNERR